MKAASSGKGGVLPWCWLDREGATKPALASAHPTKGLWPFAGTPGALGLEKNALRAFFRWRYRVRGKGGVLPWRSFGQRRGNEARTRFRPPHKVPLALCRDPRRPRIEKNALCAFLEVEVPSSRKGGVLLRRSFRQRKGDEARTRFHPPRKVPAALCRDPGRPRIGKNALCAFLEVEVPSSSKHPFFKKRETAFWLSLFFLERATRLELATSTLARWRSTR